MPTTKQEREAKWPWRIERDEACGVLYVNRSKEQFDVEDHGDYLGTFRSPAAAIYAIAKTQGE